MAKETTKETFASLGKQEALRRLFEGSGYEPFAPSAHRFFQEGIDFNLVYFPLRHLGYKVVVAVAGELLAALRHPERLSVVLGVSAKLDFEQISEFWDGVKTAAGEYGFSSLSLDLAPSQNGLLISVCGGGKMRALTETGIPSAKSKDVLFVSGRLGAAYLGFRVLEKERFRFENGQEKSEDLERYRMLVGAYLKPELDPGILTRLEDAGTIPSAACLITHGLSDAVKRIARRTGFGAKVYTGRIPFEGNSFELGKKLDVDPISAAMNGGDDYQLMVAIPIGQAESFRREFPTFEAVGHLALPEVGTVLVTPEGAELQLRAQGWNEEDSSNPQ